MNLNGNNIVEDKIKISHIKIYLKRNEINDINVNYISDALINISKNLSDFDFFEAISSLGDCFVAKSKDYLKENNYEDSVKTIILMIESVSINKELENFKHHFIFKFSRFAIDLEKLIKNKEVFEKYIDSIIINDKSGMIFYENNIKFARMYLFVGNYEKTIAAYNVTTKSNFIIKLFDSFKKDVSVEEKFRNAIAVYGSLFQTIINNFDVKYSYKSYDEMYTMFVSYKDVLKLNDFSLICYQYALLGFDNLVSKKRYDEAVLFADYCSKKNIFKENENTHKDWLSRIDKMKNKTKKVKK